jgi:hypothetical protein
MSTNLMGVESAWVRCSGGCSAYLRSPGYCALCSQLLAVDSPDGSARRPALAGATIGDAMRRFVPLSASLIRRPAQPRVDAGVGPFQSRFSRADKLFYALVAVVMVLCCGLSLCYGMVLDGSLESLAR